MTDDVSAVEAQIGPAVVLERSDLLWALQYACDIAIQAGDSDLAEELAHSGSGSEEELRKIFTVAQLLALGLQVRKIKVGIPI